MQRVGTGPKSRFRLFAVAIVVWLVFATSTHAADEASTDRAAARARIIEAYKEYKTRMAAGDVAEALGPATRAYEYAQRDLTQDDEELAITAFALGRLQIELGRPLDALRPLAHAQQCYEHQQGPLAPKSLAVLHSIAEANYTLERWETAEKTYLESIARRERMEGDQTRVLAGLNARLSKVLWDAGAKQRSQRYGMRALKLYQASMGPGALEVGLVSVQLGRNAFDLEDYDQGLKLLEYGVPLLEEGLEPGDSQLTDLYVFLVEVYSAVGDRSRERRYRLRLKKNRKRAEEIESRGASEDTR